MRRAALLCCALVCGCVNNPLTAERNNPEDAAVGASSAVAVPCQVDADCGPGGRCSASMLDEACICLSEAFCAPDSGACYAGTTPEPCACGDSCEHGWFCHTHRDGCATDADCPSDETCSVDITTQSWQCVFCIEHP
jgi:hypothetical protein